MEDMRSASTGLGQMPEEALRSASRPIPILPEVRWNIPQMVCKDSLEACMKCCQAKLVVQSRTT